MDAAVVVVIRRVMRRPGVLRIIQQDIDARQQPGASTGYGAARAAFVEPVSRSRIASSVSCATKSATTSDSGGVSKRGRRLTRTCVSSWRASAMMYCAASAAAALSTVSREWTRRSTATSVRTRLTPRGRIPGLTRLGVRPKSVQVWAAELWVASPNARGFRPRSGAGYVHSRSKRENITSSCRSLIIVLACLCPWPAIAQTEERVPKKLARRRSGRRFATCSPTPPSVRVSRSATASDSAHRVPVVSTRARKSRIALLQRSGWSTIVRCAAPGIITNCAPGVIAACSRAVSGRHSSNSPE